MDDVELPFLLQGVLTSPRSRAEIPDRAAERLKSNLRLGMSYRTSLPWGLFMWLNEERRAIIR